MNVCAINDEPEDVLTPNHLLFRKTLKIVNCNEGSELEVDELTDHKSIIDEQLKHFWSIWRKELTSLRDTLQIWKDPKKAVINTGDIVNIYEKKSLDIDGA